MSEKVVLYVSEHNYCPGNTNIPAGTVFSEAQWIDSGGSEASLKEHVAKRYIKEAVQQLPPAAVPPAVPPPVEKVKDTPHGIWNFTKEELEPFGLPILNTMYKDRAEEFGLKVEPFTDKVLLIEQMTSEA